MNGNQNQGIPPQAPQSNMRNVVLSVVGAIILIVGVGYYLYSIDFWPFREVSEVYAVSGVAKEVYDTVIIFETIPSKKEGGLGELSAVVNSSTEIFIYAYPDPDSDEVQRINLDVENIEVGDRIAITCAENIAAKKNKVFLASSIAVYK